MANPAGISRIAVAVDSVFSLGVMPKTLRRIRACGLSIVILALACGAGCSSLTSSVLSEKQIRRQIKTDYSISDPEFRESISHLLGAPIVDGNNVIELENGDQIFPAMLD